MARETDAGRSLTRRTGLTLPVTTWAPYTGPGGARGVGLADADGNIIAGLHKQTAGGELRPPGSSRTEPARRSRGGASNIGDPRLTIYWPQTPPWHHLDARPVPLSRTERIEVAAAIKAGKFAGGIPEGLPDIAHMTVDETLDVIKALKVCTVLVCYGAHVIPHA
jgi:hypothetical protein